MSVKLPPIRYLNAQGQLVPFERGNGAGMKDGINDRRNEDRIMTCKCGKKYVLHIPYELANPDCRDLCEDCIAEKFYPETEAEKGFKQGIANEVESWK